MVPFAQKYSTKKVIPVMVSFTDKAWYLGHNIYQHKSPVFPQQLFDSPYYTSPAFFPLTFYKPYLSSFFFCSNATNHITQFLQVVNTAARCMQRQARNTFCTHGAEAIHASKHMMRPMSSHDQNMRKIRLLN